MQWVFIRISVKKPRGVRLPPHCWGGMRNLQTGRRLLLLLTIVFIFVLAVSCTVSPEESSAPGTDDTAGQSLVADPVDSEATLSAVVDATIEARTSAVEGTAAAGLAIEATVGAAISETQQAMSGDPRPAPTTAAAAPPTAQPAATVMLVATSPPSGGARPAAVAAPAQAAATAAPAVRATVAVAPPPTARPAAPATVGLRQPLQRPFLLDLLVARTGRSYVHSELSSRYMHWLCWPVSWIGNQPDWWYRRSSLQFPEREPDDTTAGGFMGY
jgi:hypothetical protein